MSPELEALLSGSGITVQTEPEFGINFAISCPEGMGQMQRVRDDIIEALSSVGFNASHSGTTASGYTNIYDESIEPEQQAEMIDRLESLFSRELEVRAPEDDMPEAQRGCEMLISDAGDPNRVPNVIGSGQRGLG